MANLQADAKGPFIKRAEAGGQNTNKIMIDVMIALGLVFAFAFWKNGIKPYMDYDKYVAWYKLKYDGAMPAIPGKVYILLQPLLTLMVACVVALLCETSFFMITKKVKSFTEGLVESLTRSYCLVPPMILTLLLPVNVPIFAVVITTILMTFLGKMLFGGYGKNIFNPAAVGLVLFVSIFGGILSEYNGWFNWTTESIGNIVAGSTALENAQANGWVGTYATIVAKFGSLLDFFLGNVPGGLGETSAVVILVAGLYLLVRKAITWEIPFVYVGTIFVATWIYGIIQGVPGVAFGAWYPTFHILSGGVMFGAIFMLTEPVTSPISTRGRVIYAFIAAILTVLFRLTAGTPGGVVTAILTMNLLTTIIDNRAAIMQATGTLSKKLVSAALVVVLGVCAVGFSIMKNPNANEAVIKKAVLAEEMLLAEEPTVNGTAKTYKVLTAGFNEMEIHATVDGGKVTDLVVASHKETEGYGKALIESPTYIKKLVRYVNENKLVYVDLNGTASGFGDALTAGATKTGSALFNVAYGSLEWYANPESQPKVKVVEAGVISLAQMRTYAAQVASEGTIVNGMKHLVINHNGVAHKFYQEEISYNATQASGLSLTITIAVDANGLIQGIYQAPGNDDSWALPIKWLEANVYGKGLEELRGLGMVTDVTASSNILKTFIIKSLTAAGGAR